MLLQQMLNARVVAADGAALGKIFDFRARREGGDVLVTHIVVGPGAWAGRLRLRGALRRLVGEAPRYDIPWEAIGRVGEGEVVLEDGWGRERCEGCLRRAGERGGDER